MNHHAFQNSIVLLYANVCYTALYKAVVSTINLQNQDETQFIHFIDSPLFLKQGTFSNMHKLFYLNLTNSQIHTICFKPSIFIHMKRLTMLDLSQNKISKLLPNCFTELISLQKIVVKGNTITSIKKHSFVNITILPAMQLNSMGLNYISSDFFYSKQSNQLKLFDISNNNLTAFSTRMFWHLKNLKVLILHGNNFYHTVLDVTGLNIFLNVLYVDHSAQCSNIQSKICLVFKGNPIISISLSSKIDNAIIIVLTSGIICVLLSTITLSMGIYFKKFEKKIQHLLSLMNDLLFGIFISFLSLLFYFQTKVKSNTFSSSFILGVFLLTSFSFDLCLKLLDSICLHSITSALNVGNALKPKLMTKLILLSHVVCIITSFILIECTQIKHEMEANSKVYEMLLFTIPFATHAKAIYLFNIFTITIFFLCFDLISIATIKNITNQMGFLIKTSSNNSGKRKKNLVKRLYVNMVMKNINLLPIFIISILLLSSTSYSLSVGILVSLLGRCLSDTIIFVALNQDFGNSCICCMYRGIRKVF